MIKLINQGIIHNEPKTVSPFFWFIFIRTIFCVHKIQINQSQNKMAFLQNRSVSMVDMYIDNSEPSENVGQIHFSIEYDFQNTNLMLKVIQVSGEVYIKSFI